ncbi:hypothetical protein RJ639_000109 [Escallonia herrerae]|uniref:Fe2OG dioxygenase domain-containing protein n=1 Tax=Escallonia herrerae TaxID=1293975 RepID=A0AA89BJS6_9ASTE|nr:hypothetical protein RJ639_000109 [Escallonia herrerae]
MENCGEACFNDLPMAINVAKLRLGFENHEGRSQELTKLAAVAKEWGMFLVTNHGIPEPVLRGVKDVVKSFFQLSLEEKKASLGSYMSKENKEDGRNFLKAEDQPLIRVDRLTMKIAPKEETDRGLAVWPQTPANFRQVMESYAEKARKLCDELLCALAEALSLERNVFLQKFEPSEENEVKVKVNYYPACPRPEQVLGLPAHSDGSGLTLLMQFDTVAGLQVLKDMKWTTVSWPPDTLLLNFGDLLEIMSNGRLKSSWHRVMPPVGTDRTSIALFYNPPPHVEIEPVPIGDEDKSSIEEEYKKVVVGEYLHHLYSSRSLATSTTAIKHAITFAKA